MSVLLAWDAVRRHATVGKDWARTIIVTLMGLAALSLIYREEVVGAYRVWIGSDAYSHCFLVLPIAVFMIWRRRHSVAGLTPKPDFRFAVVILPLSLVWLVASILSILEAQQFVVMTMMQAMVLAVLGWPVYRKLMAPFLYLYFLVPSGAFLVPPLQDFTAGFAVLGLESLGVPVFSDGTIIETPAGTFVVAEACAGLRFLIASIAFGVFYATEIYRSRARRLAFIALSIIVPIVANGLRALGLILAAEAVGSAAAMEADHITYGWAFFSIVLLALIMIGNRFSDRHGESVGPLPKTLPAQPNYRTQAFAGVLSVGLAGLGPAAATTLDTNSIPVAGVAPSTSPPWRSLRGEAADWRPNVVQADREFLDRFTDGQNRVDRFVALYAQHGRTSNLIRSANRIADLKIWRVARRGQATVQIGLGSVTVNATEIVAGDRRRVVWSFYALNGTIAATIAAVKWHHVSAYLNGAGCPSAFVAVSAETTPDSPSPEEALRNYLSAMEPLPPYLCSAHGSTAVSEDFTPAVADESLSRLTR